MGFSSLISISIPTSGMEVKKYRTSTYCCKLGQQERASAGTAREHSFFPHFPGHTWVSSICGDNRDNTDDSGISCWHWHGVKTKLI